MLIIKENGRASCTRPKYHPRNMHSMWVVLDTAPGRKAVRVFGPDTRYACERYQRENQ